MGAPVVISASCEVFDLKSTRSIPGSAGVVAGFFFPRPAGGDASAPREKSGSLVQVFATLPAGPRRKREAVTLARVRDIFPNFAPTSLETDRHSRRRPGRPSSGFGRPTP